MPQGCLPARHAVHKYYATTVRCTTPIISSKTIKKITMLAISLSSLLIFDKTCQIFIWLDLIVHELLQDSKWKSNVFFKNVEMKGMSRKYLASYQKGLGQHVEKKICSTSREVWGSIRRFGKWQHSLCVCIGNFTGKNLKGFTEYFLGFPQ